MSRLMRKELETQNRGGPVAAVLQPTAGAGGAVPPLRRHPGLDLLAGRPREALPGGQAAAGVGRPRRLDGRVGAAEGRQGEAGMARTPRTSTRYEQKSADYQAAREAARRGITWARPSGSTSRDCACASRGAPRRRGRRGGASSAPSATLPAERAGCAWPRRSWPGGRGGRRPALGRGPAGAGPGATLRDEGKQQEADEILRRWRSCTATTRRRRRFSTRCGTSRRRFYEAQRKRGSVRGSGPRLRCGLSAKTPP